MGDDGWQKLRECIADRGGPRAQADLADVLAHLDRYRAVLERCHRILGHPSRAAPADSVTRIIHEALRDER